MMIPNFKQVLPFIYRGGQPMGKEDFDSLRSLGITRIIKLNFENDTDESLHGFEVIRCEISLAQQLIQRPRRGEFSKAVTSITPGTFVHCEHGQDRTGLVIGAYRVWYQNWTKDDAFAEMLANGFHPMLLGLTAFFDEFV